MSTPDSPTPATPPRSPFVGCFILGLAAVMVLGLALFSWWTLQRQGQEIARFTQTTAHPVPLLEASKHPAELNSLAARLSHFRHEVENQRPAQLRLSTQDLNLAIAAYPELEELRQTFHVAEITPEALTADISFPLGQVPLSKRENFLNGQLVTTPLLGHGLLFLKIQEIKSAVGTVPEPFREHLSPYAITQRYEEHPTLAPLLARLTTARLEADALILEANPEAALPELPKEGKEAADQARNLIALGAVIFLLSFILLLVLLSRFRRSRREK